MNAGKDGLMQPGADVPCSRLFRNICGITVVVIVTGKHHLVPKILMLLQNTGNPLSQRITLPGMPTVTEKRWIRGSISQRCTHWKALH